MRIAKFSIGLIALLLLALPLAAQQDQYRQRSVGDLGQVGTVAFPTSCSAAAQPTFERGLALLHSFFYEEAARVFTQAATQDPHCAMAHWGQAMTYWHQLWSPPSEADLAAGKAALAAAHAAGNVTPREQAYLDAADKIFGNAAPAADASCSGGELGAFGCRAQAYKQAMADLHAAYPDDLDATVFYALSILAVNPRDDSGIPGRKEAGAILEPLFAKYPHHPGIAHYLIHAYDYPGLAEKALPAARTYAQIAPWVPHALHMPSHIFTRLGLWDEAVDTNRNSAHAAQAYAERQGKGWAVADEFHALDYMAYAIIQTGRTRMLRPLWKRLKEIQYTRPAESLSIDYAVTAISARLVLEQRRWKDAIHLELPTYSWWHDSPVAESNIIYARGAGAGRIGRVKDAEAAAARLQELIQQVTKPQLSYFKAEMENERQAVLAWIAFWNGDRDQAAEAMRAAADREDGLGLHGLSPNVIFPIRELLGDMLLEMKRPADALAAYQASLKLRPRRFAGVFGAARAAELTGDKALAKKYYTEFMDVARFSKDDSVELVQARNFLAGSPNARFKPEQDQ